MDDDMTCPQCGSVSVRRSPTVGDRDDDDYECLACQLAFSISGSDRSALAKGEPARLGPPDATGRMWLRPDSRTDV
jgi:hypothetical protein